MARTPPPKAVDPLVEMRRRVENEELSARIYEARLRKIKAGIELRKLEAEEKAAKT